MRISSKSLNRFFYAAIVLSAFVINSVQAALFEDNDARRQINVLTESVKNNQRALIELTNANEQLVQENAKLRGKIEELERLTDEQSTNLKSYYSEINDRLKRLEPQNIEVEGIKGSSQPGEKELYDQALKEFREGSPSEAEALLTQFVLKYPSSPYWPVAQYWLSASKYASRDYKGSINVANVLLKRYPEHARAPEAMLNIANCQLESNQKSEARKTLDALIKKFPESKSADTARSTLSKLK